MGKTAIVPEILRFLASFTTAIVRRFDLGLNMRLLLIVLLLLFSALPAAAQHGENRHFFKDWLAACRSDGYCSALAYVNPHADGTDADYILRVGRHAEQTYWELSVTTVATQGDAAKDFVVGVDGLSQTFAGPEQVGAYDAINDFFLLGDGAQTVMDRLAPGKRLSVSFTDDTGASRSAAFSLAGLSAALLWIDDQQKRVGSERVTSAPPYGLTPVDANGPQTASIPAALLDRLRADPECEPLETLPNGRDFQVGKIDADHTLYVLPCWSGAYNFGSKVFITSEAEGIQTQYFSSFYPEKGMIAASYLVNADYDEATKTLSSFSKSRGIGDCGNSGDWVWTDYGFALKTFRYKECPDTVSEDEEIGDFPVVYEVGQ